MELCECGRVIDGSRTLSASVFVKCSRCRRKPRVKRTLGNLPALPQRDMETLLRTAIERHIRENNGLVTAPDKLIDLIMEGVQQ